jgi:hypothetical protein
MSKTATRDDRTLDQESSPAASPLVPPPKLRRRPALIVAALIAICLGALLAAWAWTATTTTQEVLVARDTIERGAVIEAGDLARVRVSADPALRSGCCAGRRQLDRRGRSYSSPGTRAGSRHR